MGALYCGAHESIGLSPNPARNGHIPADAVVLAIIVGAPKLAAWIDYRYALSMRHVRGR